MLGGRRSHLKRSSVEESASWGRRRRRGLLPPWSVASWWKQKLGRRSGERLEEVARAVNRRRVDLLLQVMLRGPLFPLLGLQAGPWLLVGWFRIGQSGSRMAFPIRVDLLFGACHGPEEHSQASLVVGPDEGGGEVDAKGHWAELV